jgi:hypothetical protein
MSFVPLAIQQNLHRETYVAMLDSLLRAPGAKRLLAARAGITPVYLSNLLNLQREGTRDGTARTPSPKVASRIADELDVDKEIRESILAHMLAARAASDALQKRARIGEAEGTFTVLLDDARRLSSEATFAATPETARRNYRAALQLAKTGISIADRRFDVLAFMELCFIIHDAQCVLNRPDDALWYGLLADWVAQFYESDIARCDRERFDGMATNAIRAVVVAYNNLSLFDEALRFSERAELSPGLKRAPNEWKPHVFRDKMRSLSGKSRFAISEIEYLAEQVARICDQRTDEAVETLNLLNTEILARAYLAHNNYIEAYRLLSRQWNELTHVRRVGPLHRVMLLQTYARAAACTGRLDEGMESIQQAEQLARNAGLDHQLTRIQTIQSELSSAGLAG